MRRRPGGRALTERLWLTEPRRKTALANVLEVRRGAFRLDRSLYCPKSRSYRHPQPADGGTVWTATGEKRRLATVFDDDGVLWHRLRDAVPKAGDVLQCHLDVDRRAHVEIAHTAMHLLLHTAPRDLGALVADPEVRGGGHVRFMFDRPWLDRTVLTRWMEAAHALAKQDRPITRAHLVDTAVAHQATPQPFAEGGAFPGPDTTRECVTIEGVGTLPCDGTLAARTGVVASLTLQEAHPTRDGQMLVVVRARG